MIAHNTLRHVDIEDPTDPRIPPLLSDLAGGNPVVRERARETLVAIGKPVVPALIQMLSYRRPLARWEAAKALCGIADPLAATALVNALDDEDDEVRWVAAEGVAALGGYGLAALLAELLERARSSWFRQGRTTYAALWQPRKGSARSSGPCWRHSTGLSRRSPFPWLPIRHSRSCGRNCARSLRCSRAAKRVSAQRRTKRNSQLSGRAGGGT